MRLLTVAFAFCFGAASAAAADKPPSRLVAPASSGCGKKLPRGIAKGTTNQTQTIDVSGVRREYLIYIPNGYRIDKPAPLILSFHGRSQNMRFQEELSQFSNETYNNDSIAVYPNGMKTARTRQWLGDPEAPAAKYLNDFDLTTALISHVAEAYCVDARRVYATGKSNGGGFAALLACNATTAARIAAFAPVSPALYKNVTLDPRGPQTPEDALPPCTPAASRLPVPIVEFHGLRDGQIAYDGASKRGKTAVIPAYMNAWAARDGFDPLRNETQNVCDGTGRPAATRFSWGGGVVQHYRVANLGHTWPDQYWNVDNGSQTCFDATGVIMDFFRRFRLE